MMVDAVLAYNPNRKRELHVPEVAPSKNWSVPIDRVFSHGDQRFDASFFDPKVAADVGTLDGHATDRLDELATLILPGRFERVWADQEHGKPYLNATDLLTLFSLGVPAKVRYLSPDSNTDIDALVIRKDWLLMTCSGTIGRVFHVPRRLDGWAATHDLIRIVPHSPDRTGYLYAWCCTSVAQTQIRSHTHGGQINHVTDDQVGKLLVPRLHERTAENLNRRVMDALEDREQALNTLVNAWPSS